MKLLYATIFALILCACTKSNESNEPAKFNVIPKPSSVNATGDVFKLSKESSILVDSDSEELGKVAKYLADRLNPATGFNLKVSSVGTTTTAGNIILSTSGKDEKLGEEGYELVVTEDGIKITANKPAGVFRGIQTLRQIFPHEIELTSTQEREWEIPAGTIKDFPSYSFRGSMLDVSRHFFSVEDVKKYIDVIAFYKMNVLHLHLSDDQGWRIEIKSWPNLTAHGANSEVGEGKGGFYTQEQYKDIVQYAADRYITVIPEIDIPGHTNAALSSYPELNCNGKAPDLYRGTEVGFSTLCATKEITYKFINDVVRELALITPGPYLHLGGDESHATKHEDYITIVNRTQQIVEANGKKMIGWEEVSQSTLTPSTVVQYWSNIKNAEEAAAKGAKIIISPATKVYLDMKYDSTTKLGQDWAARIEVDSSYNWNVATKVKGLDRKNILGIEAPLWTETLTNMEEIEYMLFPRILGIAELGWSSDNDLTWEEYKVRLGRHAPRLKAMNINYYPSKQITWSE